MPKVSICLLTYNRAHVLPRTVASLLGQTHGDFELVINDDCSTDATEAVCREFEKQDSRVIYFRNERNLRYAGNQNAALKRARGEWICYVHDGDIYRRDMIERWIDIAARHPDVGFVFNSQASLDESGVMVREHFHPYPEYTPGLVFFDYLIGRPDIPVWGILMVRRSLLEEVGPFDSRFPVLADVDMWFRLMLRAPVGYVRECLFAIHPREKGHANRGVNWAIEAEHEAIHLINLRRRHSHGGQLFDERLAGVDGMNRKRQLFALAWCLSKLRLRRFVQGMRHVMGYKARRRILIGSHP